MPSLDIRPDHLHIVRDILQKHVPNHEVWAFGSRAKWTARETSDLDLCVQGDEPLSFESMGLLRAAFEESDLPYKVDVVDWATTGEAFRKIIERDKVIVKTKREQDDWQECSLGDVIELKRGYDLPQQKRKPGPVPIVSSSGISDYHAEAMAKAPGVVTGRYGTIGKVFFLERDYWPLNTKLYVREFKGNDPKFISYLLETIDLHAYSDKGAVPGVNRNHLHMARVKVPPLPKQRAIAHILGTFDDKIELNRSINQTLEAMAQAIFKSWFVDFDPVKAKIAAQAEGRDPLRAAMRAISGKTDAELEALPREHYDQLAATAALFPNEMEESELGEIPKGWSIQPLGEFLELSYGKALPKEQRKEGAIPVYGSGGVGGFHESALVVAPGIVVGRKGTVGSLFWVEEDFYAIDTVFYVKPLSKIPLYWIYQLLKTVDIASLGADSAVPGVNRNTIYGQMAVVPSSSVLETFEKTLSPVVSEIKTLLNQTSSLAALRDALLPKLLSGELSVTDIASPIDEAAS